MSSDGSLRRSAIKLALAGGVEYALQLAMPVILVRCLDVTSFGQYRLLWLLASTALAIAPAFMPQALFYFLPRAEGRQRALVLGNVLLFLLVAGGVAALLVTGWNPLLPLAARNLFFATHGISALFLMLWVIASMFDVLPTAEGKVRWQANSTMLVALLRTLLLGGAAWASHSIVWVVGAMLAVALIKLLMLAHYLWAENAGGKLGFQRGLLKTQLAYALPFAMGNALFLMRIQADQWVVATMLAPALFATFSIAIVLQPVATLIRLPVYNAMMPRLHGAYAKGDLPEIIRLITKSNGATAFLLLPIAGALFTLAPELVSIVYTDRYQQTAPIMQVYIIGMMGNAFAVGHVLPALEKGRFATINNAVCLVVSVALSLLGVLYFGLIGAAFGSVISLMLSELWSGKVVADKLGISIGRLLSLRDLMPTLFATGVAIAGVYLLVPTLWRPIPLLFVKGLTYTALFGIVFVLVGGLHQLKMLRELR
jgi:O-antigen/teichoic acid export membrane protein